MIYVTPQRSAGLLQAAAGKLVCHNYYDPHWMWGYVVLRPPHIRGACAPNGKLMTLKRRVSFALVRNGYRRGTHPEFWVNSASDRYADLSWVRTGDVQFATDSDSDLSYFGQLILAPAAFLREV